MNIDEKLKEILSWLNKHGLSKEASELEELLKEASSVGIDADIEEFLGRAKQEQYPLEKKI